MNFIFVHRTFNIVAGGSASASDFDASSYLGARSISELEGQHATLCSRTHWRARAAGRRARPIGAVMHARIGSDCSAHCSAGGVPSCLWCAGPRAYSVHMVHIVHMVHMLHTVHRVHIVHVVHTLLTVHVVHTAHMVHTVHTVPVGYLLSHLARADLIKMFGFDQNLI